MTKYALYIILLLAAFSCIEKFDLNQSIEFQSKLVVDGLILDKPVNGVQQIRISRSSAIDEANYIPEVGCMVVVHDGEGNAYTFEEYYVERGLYEAIIPAEKLSIGSSFWLEIITADGKTYQSSEEKMYACPPVDEVYYDVIEKPTSDPTINTWGAEFFVDFVADDKFGAYYRFNVEQTYEYRSTWAIDTFINEFNVWFFGPIDFTKYYCYRTNNVPQIYTLSTQGYTHNSYIKYPLYFVDNKEQHLAHNYSILVKQYSMGKEAFIFWDNMRKNNQSSVDMFGSQPVAVKGNIASSSDDDDDDVLGYFGVSSVSESRLVIKGGIEMPFDYYTCELVGYEMGLPTWRPLYLSKVKLPDGKVVWGSAASDCWDCTLKGGVTEKPDFFE